VVVVVYVCDTTWREHLLHISSTQIRTYTHQPTPQAQN